MTGDGSGRPIRFGSGGWRGVLGEDFDFPRARALARAVAGWAHAERPGAALLVAHDTRFLADRAADEVAAAIREAGVPVLRVRGAIPTPVACRAVVRRRCAGGLVVTASHNPAEYLGVKVLGPRGGGVPRQVATLLERAAATALAGRARRLRAGPARSRAIEPVEPYLSALTRLLDRRALARGRLRVAYDALHGTGAGILDRLLVRCGVQVVLLRGAPDARFGGVAPDPSGARLAPLAAALRGPRSPRLGLATDGDADRFAAVDTGGRVLAEGEALALLVDHLARTRGVRGVFALSRAAGSLAARVAEGHGLRVVRPGVGFGPLSELLCTGEATLAGDESGGFAWAPFAREKDGILAAALLAERAALEGAPLRAALRDLERRFGPSACGREALPGAARLAPALARLAAAPPERFDGSAVRSAETEGGLRLDLADGGFVLWRSSGTEPVLRLYAEASSARALRRRLRAARALLARLAGRALRTR